jgi:hypothetical protein
MKDKTKLIVGNTYQIRYNESGVADYNHYNGIGVYNGQVEDIDGEVFGFDVDGDSTFFPLDSIFEDV